MKNADIQWQHGQPFNTTFDDIYFSREGGLAEAEYVFLQQNGLPERWMDRKNFTIAETGFGTGLNFLVTVLHWLKSTDDNFCDDTCDKACLHYISIQEMMIDPFSFYRPPLHVSGVRKLALNGRYTLA